MRVGCTQPTYLPWCGLFGHISLCDTFVWLDDVAFSSQSWQSRNRIKTPNGPMWLTVPVLHEFGQKINEVQIKDSNWQRKHWESIKQAYSKAPYWDMGRDYLEYLYQSSYPKLNLLIDTNIALIMALGMGLNIKWPEIIRSSQIRAPAEASEGTATDRLVSLLFRLGATEYLANPGSMAYLTPELHKFAEVGIELKVFNFEHPVYPQIHGKFVSHLSAIDLLFNTGPKALEYIREGIKLD